MVVCIVGQFFIMANVMLCHGSMATYTITKELTYFLLTMFVSFPQTSEDVMTWGSPRARVYVKCVGTVRAASHPPVWIHRKCELRSLKKMLNSLCWDDDYTIAQWLEHR